MKPLITILTPTYNRANLLERVYKSLQTQTNKNFEWLVIDDGSTDDTEDIIKSLNAQGFNLRYIYKENGGKHTALNLGVKEAQGEFILILDSDDYLTRNAIESILNKLSPEKVAGLAFRRIDKNHEIVGSDNFSEVIATPLEIRYRYKVKGDLVEVFKKDVLTSFPFPEFKDEKFCPEALIWNRIAQKHQLHYFNEGFYVTEYLSGGLTDKIVKIRMESPKASMVHYSELASYKIPFIEKIKAHINFWRFSLNTQEWSFKKKVSMVNLWYIPFCLPLGFLMHLNDKRKTA